MEERFLNPETVLFNAGLNHGDTVVDLGAGSGFFALAAAKSVGSDGQVYVVDILEKSLEQVASSARIKNYHNIKTFRQDLENGKIATIPEGSANMVLVNNVLHQIKNHQIVLVEIYRILKTGGKLLIIDWRPEQNSMGPKSAVRIPQEKIKKLASDSTFKFESEIETDQFHYGLLFIK